MTATDLKVLLARMKSGEIVPLPEKEEWKEMIARTTAPGRICEVDEETFDYFLEVLPPRFMGRGVSFGFGEGADPLRLFWQSEGKFFCRQLTDDESQQLCGLLGIPLTTG